MNITYVRIKVAEEADDNLQAFCTITIDGAFVVRDLKVIGNEQGSFVAMPSRKITRRCPKCPGKNEVRAKYCSSCGTRMPGVSNDETHRAFYDIAHPINAAGRKLIENAVLTAFDSEKILAAKPGYVSRFDDHDQ
jgi:stage V sporulation protein G